jgi:guanylate kinase
MTPIFHIIGTVCSGKTTIVDKIKQAFPEDIFHWDILQFYLKNEIIIDGEMNWERFGQFVPVIGLELENFIATNKNSIIIIESSGFNKKINEALEKYEVRIVSLKTPDEEELVRRAKLRGLSASKTIKFAMDHENLMDKRGQLNEEEAYKKLHSAVVRILINK